MLRRVLIPLLAAVTIAAAAPAAVADPAPPSPAQDPFYTAPTSLAGAPGDVIRQRVVDLYAEPFRVFPAPVKAWQVVYRSTSATGGPNAVSGTVIVPPIPWTGQGERPIVAYAMGTQGLADNCAPSYHLRNGDEVEIAFIVQAMLKGWAVAVTDYEGLGMPGTHTYAVGQSAGRALLDVARAAVRVPEAGLSASAPVGAFGYSQGGQAAAFAGELQAAYAPEVKLAGVSEGGVPADLNLVAKSNDGGIGFGLVVGAATGLATAYPELPFDAILTARGKQLVETAKNSCVVGLVAAAPFGRLSTLTTDPDVLNDPRWKVRLAENQLGNVKPAAPIYLYHGTADELIPYSGAVALKNRYCAVGANIQWQPVPLAGHVVGVSVWGTTALNWLGDRMAGKPATPTC
ncbi:MAG: hypothetical protein QOI21_3862 [Actinomycetota bacterium]|jgi:fermentation-respiration switch protein FrsA (DUF1100 family)|nr:hypothetical protein [Actinomycetota bacterium]